MKGVHTAAQLEGGELPIMARVWRGQEQSVKGVHTTAHTAYRRKGSERAVLSSWSSLKLSRKDLSQGDGATHRQGCSSHFS